MSSRRDIRSFLWDVENAADGIFHFTENLREEDFLRSDLIKAAVDRKFMVIGEALNALSKIDPDLAKRIPELPNIISFRNLLVHGYFEVDYRRVWIVISRDLPRLKAVAAELMKELGE